MQRKRVVSEGVRKRRYVSVNLTVQCVVGEGDKYIVACSSDTTLYNYVFTTFNQFVYITVSLLHLLYYIHSCRVRACYSSYPNSRMSRDAAHKEQTLKVLYSELNKLGQNGEYEKAIKTANRSKYRLHVTRTQYSHPSPFSPGH